MVGLRTDQIEVYDVSSHKQPAQLRVMYGLIFDIMLVVTELCRHRLGQRRPADIGRK